MIDGYWISDQIQNGYFLTTIRIILIVSINYQAAITRILKEKIKYDETHAWDFSIFNIVKINRPEENLHSPLIKELLGNFGHIDPLFLSLF